MGQISNVLGRVYFQDNPCDYMDMELNTNRTVHLQSNCWRIELTEQEYESFLAYIRSLGHEFEVKDIGVSTYQDWFGHFFK